MNDKELRRGNLVDFKGIGIKEVWGIHSDGVSHFSSQFRKFDQIYPVSITKEILIDFGFQSINESYFEKDGFGLICGYATDGSFVCGNSFGSRHCHFYYVHQLQNIYFAVTCSELQCSLNGC